MCSRASPHWSPLVFINQVPAVSNLHEEASCPNTQYSLMSQALEKLPLPMRLSIPTIASFPHPLPQPLCPLYGDLLGVLTSLKCRIHEVDVLEDCSHSSLTKSLKNEGLPVEGESETRMMTRGSIILPQRVIQREETAVWILTKLPPTLQLPVTWLLLTQMNP